MNLESTIPSYTPEPSAAEQDKYKEPEAVNEPEGSSKRTSTDETIFNNEVIELSKISTPVVVEDPTFPVPTEQMLELTVPNIPRMSEDVYIPKPQPIKPSVLSSAYTSIPIPTAQTSTYRVEVPVSSSQ
ncbi:hypothetical protein L6452_31065 [Arctium lappa]|uniref:Uncharacterized protein n=1 Tax=Arctium lappa TaxID=4217 RepID=A0ACB8ZKW2_ARCLA|nr:hypothetical protein L6452_31065 [Arctium lappa]